MIEQLIPLLTGGAGGLLGGNLVGSLFSKSGMGVGSRSMTGIIAGAAASYFFGPTMGPMIGGLLGGGGGDMASMLGGVVAGAGGGGVGSLAMGMVRKMMG